MIAYLGFIIAAYAVIGNDVIQTLGTFIQSNKKRPWYQLFLFIGGLLTFVLWFGWYVNNGDPSYGRLAEINRPNEYSIWYLLPPLVLLFITRFGIPVSTTFLMLSIFSTDVLLSNMLLKSFMGYVLAFCVSFLIYQYVLYKFEDSTKKTKASQRNLWIALQWLSTSFLWSQWLIQDFANIYVFLPAQIDFNTMLVSLLCMLFILAYILKSKGGAIQKVVSTKVNSSNIKSATFIDFIYGFVLLFFTIVNNVPMSTTWAFVGILAGREIALRNKIFVGTVKEGMLLIRADFLKVSIGIGISIGMIVLLKQFGVL